MSNLIGTNTLDVTCHQVGALSIDQQDAWRQITASDLKWQSPFYSLEYHQTIGKIRSDVEVAVVRDSGESIAFFPFHRNGTKGTPVGGRLSDFHGVIGELPSVMCCRKFLNDCGLTSWKYDNLPQSQTCFASSALNSVISSFVLLENGWDGYLKHLSENSNGLQQEVRRKRRKLEREVGAVRFVQDDPDASVLEQLIQWKSEQRKRTGTFDVLKLAWVRQALDAFRANAQSDVRGRVTSLYAGDRLVAAHFGLISKTVSHYWFPTYDVELGSCSPGTILFFDMIEAAASEGHRRVDLGKGTDRFKMRFSNGHEMVCEAGIDRTSIGSTVRRVTYAIRKNSRKLPFQQVLQPCRKLWNAWTHP